MSWSELSKVIGKGTVDEFYSRVDCNTDEEVEAACTVLGLMKKWNIGHLYLPDNMRAEDWSVLTKEVARKGEVCVSKSALRVASAQQVRDLLRGTSGWWWVRNYNTECRITIAGKSDGGADLEKLLAFKKNISGT